MKINRITTFSIIGALLLLCLGIFLTITSLNSSPWLMLAAYFVYILAVFTVGIGRLYKAATLILWTLFSCFFGATLMLACLADLLALKYPWDSVLIIISISGIIIPPIAKILLDAINDRLVMSEI